MCITNKVTGEQSWFNDMRTRKPQTFKAPPSTSSSPSVAQTAVASPPPTAAVHDPTEGGRTCDFCKWERLTAEDDSFGRIERAHAVTGSNLFKYGEPCHGLVRREGGALPIVSRVQQRFSLSAADPFLAPACRRE